MINFYRTRNNTRSVLVKTKTRSNVTVFVRESELDKTNVKSISQSKIHEMYLKHLANKLRLERDLRLLRDTNDLYKKRDILDEIELCEKSIQYWSNRSSFDFDIIRKQVYSLTKFFRSR